jgi:hypothetical protein
MMGHNHGQIFVARLQTEFLYKLRVYLCRISYPRSENFYPRSGNFERRSGLGALNWRRKEEVLSQLLGANTEPCAGI